MGAERVSPSAAGVVPSEPSAFACGTFQGNQAAHQLTLLDLLLRAALGVGEAAPHLGVCPHLTSPHAFRPTTWVRTSTPKRGRTVSAPRGLAYMGKELPFLGSIACPQGLGGASWEGTRGQSVQRVRGIH